MIGHKARTARHAQRREAIDNLEAIEFAEQRARIIRLLNLGPAAVEITHTLALPQKHVQLNRENFDLETRR